MQFLNSLKLHSVPYEYKDNIDKDIDRLIADGILELLKTPDWTALIVLLQDGRI